MPLFKYRALDRSGKVLSATIDAATSQEVREFLKGNNLVPSLIEQADKDNADSFLSQIFERGVDVKTKVFFTRQMSVLLKATVPLLDVIALLIGQFEGSFKRVLITVRDGLKEGRSLADALEDHPKVFDNVYVQLVRAGEASGGLEKILDRLTVQLERSEELGKKVSSAMRYPIFMLVVSFGVVIAASIFIIPAIAKTLQEMGTELPALTLNMIAFSKLFTEYWLWMLIGVSAVLFAFFKWKSSKNGKHTLDKLLLKLPLTSKLTKTSAIVEFTKTLGMLQEAGVNLSDSLSIVCDVVNNSVLAEYLREARSNIIKEGKIAKFLQQTGIFPPIAHYMIRTGEESGNLAQMLLQVGHDYEQEMEESIDTLTAAISPVMNLVIAGVVLLIVLALFLPMLEMSNLQGI
ncbi:type II secretion system F family protein [Candidatus Babeliales bacterium]|nr:type II secretion system F family protein [Candidatus Babeliales bacterium]